MARKKPVKLRTPEEVKADFERRGMSFSKWAREHGVNRGTVHHVLQGKPARIGDSHKVAVLLGLKDGVIG